MPGTYTVPTLTPATALTGTELVEVVQAGNNRKATVADFTAVAVAAANADIGPDITAAVAAEAALRIADDNAEAVARITADNLRLLKTGGTMTGDIVMSGGAEMTGLPTTPTAPDRATSKAYVDNTVATAAAGGTRHILSSTLGSFVVPAGIFYLTIIAVGPGGDGGTGGAADLNGVAAGGGGGAAGETRMLQVSVVAGDTINWSCNIGNTLVDKNGTLVITAVKGNNGAVGAGSNNPAGMALGGAGGDGAVAGGSGGTLLNAERGAPGGVGFPMFTPVGGPGGYGGRNPHGPVGSGNGGNGGQGAYSGGGAVAGGAGTAGANGSIAIFY